MEKYIYDVYYINLKHDHKKNTSMYCNIAAPFLLEGDPSQATTAYRSRRTMPKKIKRRSTLSYRHKKGTGNSRIKRGVGKREILAGKSSGGWAPSTTQNDDGIVDNEVLQQSQLMEDVHASPPCPDTTCTIGTTTENATPSSSSATDGNTNNTDSITMLPSSLNDPVRNVSSTIVTPASISRYRRKKIRSAPNVSFDDNAFSQTKGGKKRTSGVAAQIAKRRAINSTVDNLMDLETDAQRAVVLQGTLQHPKMASIAKAVGYIQPEEVILAVFKQQQQYEAIAKALETDKTKGRVCDDQSNFVDSVFLANAANVDSEDAPSLNSQARSLPMPRSSALRRLKNGIQRRAKVFTDTVGIRWSTGSRMRKRYSKVTPEKRAALDKWIRGHHDVVQSPIAKDTIQVYNPETKYKEPKPKLLLMISVRELHNDMTKPVEAGGFEYAHSDDGKLLISDTMLRSLLPKELRRMTERHKQMCGCETCIVGRSQLRSIRAYRTRTLRSLKAIARDAPPGAEKRSALNAAALYEQQVCHPTGEIRPATIHESIKLVQCPNLDGFSFPKWSCVLGCCNDCPDYDDSIPDHEKQTESNELCRITFDVYKPYTKCSKHGLLPDGSKTCPSCENMTGGGKKGKVRTKKELTQLTKPIGVFHEEYFKIAMENLAYHHPHVTMLGKRFCGKLRTEALLENVTDVATIRDYAERLKAAFNGEIQTTHFGNNRDLSMEGCAVKHVPQETVESLDEGQKPSEDDIAINFHSHLSDESAQDAFTTHDHMKTCISDVREDGFMKSGSTLWDNTDGCMKQYRSANVMFLLWAFAWTYNIIIDRAIGAPGHGKDVVDGLNATDKRHLTQLLQYLDNVWEEDNHIERKMPAHSMTEEGEFSLAELAAERLRHESRASGVKGAGAKHAKRESSAKVKSRTYHVHRDENVKHRGLKKVATGFEKGPHNGIMGHYNIRADPDLPHWCVVVRRIPCACTGCRAQLKQQWDSKLPFQEQPRYKASTDCQMYKIFEGLNDWKLIRLVDTKDSDIDLNDEVHELVLEGITERLATRVEAGGYGAVSTDDPEADGYYVLQWDSEPREVEEDVVIDEKEFHKGDKVVDGTYLNRVPLAKRWYTRATESDKESLETTVLLSHVVFPDMSLTGESDTQTLSSNCNRRAAQRLGAVRVSETEHELILDEISRRDVLEFIDNSRASDDEETDSEDDDDSDSEDDEE